jgi:hypothetical protein
VAIIKHFQLIMCGRPLTQNSSRSTQAMRRESIQNIGNAPYRE